MFNNSHGGLEDVPHWSQGEEAQGGATASGVPHTERTVKILEGVGNWIKYDFEHVAVDIYKLDAKSTSGGIALEIDVQEPDLEESTEESALQECRA